MSSPKHGLRVALDARPLTTSRAGVATYCRGLVYGLRAVAPRERIILYAKEPPPDLGLESTEPAPDPWADVPVSVGVPSVPASDRGPAGSRRSQGHDGGPAGSRRSQADNAGDVPEGTLRWQTMPAPLWLPLAVPRALRAGRVDVFHGTNHMAPPLGGGPCVVTVHDLSALSMPEYHTWRNRLLTVPQMLLSLRRATRLIAVSSHTAGELAALPGIDAARIRVVHEAPAPGLAPAPPDAVQELRRRLDLPEAFALFLGALEPRKNVATLIRALARLWADGAGVPLVIAGAEGWRNDDVRAEVARLGMEAHVRFAGYVAPDDLAALYGAATVFVYPSIFEGFGLPPLEAMACGAPVICSNTSSLPEVVGGAAIQVDPRDAEALAAALRRVFDDAEARASLRAAGLARAGLFSWERAARETLAVYHEAASERPRKRRP